MKFAQKIFIVVMLFSFVACSQKQNGTFVWSDNNMSKELTIKNVFGYSTDFHYKIVEKDGSNEKTMEGKMTFLSKIDLHTTIYEINDSLMLSYNDERDDFDMIHKISYDHKDHFPMKRVE